jgi:hypothetical protein
MAWYLVQAGAKLYAMATDGSSTEITLPSGVVLDTTRRLRAAILNRTLVVVNAPNRSLGIDPDGTCRSLVPAAPVFAPTLAVGVGTGLTGTYQVKYSNIIKNEYGAVVAESPLSPEAEISGLTNDSIAVSNIALSPDLSPGVGRRLYRTAAGGDVFFEWIDLDDNVQTTIDNGMDDAALAIAATLNSDLGLPPGSSGASRMKNIVAWKDRLFGVSDDASEVDNARYTASLQPWAWPAGNSFPIPKVGADASGIVAFIPRRDDLGIAKRSSVHKIIGEDDDTLQRLIVTENAGLVAPDSVAVIRNIGYGLGADGIYTYSDDGFKNISINKVHAWFTSDTYFNRAMFPDAIGRWNPVTDSYELHLAAAGSSVLDRWISFDIKNQVFLGPHKTDLFTPTAASGDALDGSGNPIAVVGGNNGFIYTMNRTTRTDGASTAIDFDMRSIHAANTPDIEKVFEQMDVLTKVEVSGTLTITPTVGGLNASAGASFPVDLTLGRERTVILGAGRILQLRWQQATAGVDTMIYGGEIPYFELGRK